MSTQHKDAVLKLREVGKVDGSFFVARYQRGYRWGEQEVSRLLDDLAESAGDDYSLQPVVVKKRGEKEWELVDGQQRLTTLYLLYLYMQREGLKNVPPGYSITYETRPLSQSYLSELDEARAEDNIDFFHLYGAYRCIAGWFERRELRERQFLADKLYQHLYESVRIIWYEAPPDADPIALFTRLNIGRIPLTDAELVKALMLARARGTASDDDRAHEVAAQWDGIERDLRRPEVWAFVTDIAPADAPTRISLLLDVLADLMGPPVPRGRRPLFYTFDTLRAAIEREPGSWKNIWNRVVELHARVLGWFEDRSTYHKIGYLVSAGARLTTLIEQAENRTKSDFKAHLDDQIRQTLKLSASEVRELSYEGDGDKIERLLLLMNVETVSRMEHSSERYSFRLHRAGKWSLEHVHAQHTESLTRAEQWREWLTLHRDALMTMPVDDETARDSLVERIGGVLEKVTREVFKSLASEVETMFGASEEQGASALHTVHSISNLALIEVGDNAALSNAVFEVKRRRVLKLDACGAYIPECTRRVFLKYYTAAAAQQMHFWGVQDREGYLEAMLDPDKGALTPYLTLKATVEEVA